MEYLIDILLFLLLIIVLYLYYLTNKQYKNLKKTKIEEFTVETKTQCEAIKKEKEKEVKEYEQILNDKTNSLQKILSEKEKRYEEVNLDLELYREGKLKEIDGTAAEYEQRKRQLVDSSVDKYREMQTTYANNYFNSLKAIKESRENEIKEITDKLEIERRKRDAINEEILRQRKVAEEQDFYKIKFSEQDKNDIEILRPIAPRLQHPEVINKIIWNSYYQKPLAELRKRLLPNGDKSGIYKITRIKTNEIYIGQTTSFDRRFQDHVKTALGVGTLASSQLHRVMAEDGPENFYFEILEEVERDKLKERESYYIDWFKSNKFGLNTIRGQQNGI